MVIAITEAHVGFYLIDRGLPQLEREVAYRLSFVTRVRRAIGKSMLFFLSRRHPVDDGRFLGNPVDTRE